MKKGSVWNELQHPREKDGKFAHGSGSGWAGKLSDRIGNDMLSPEIRSTRDLNQADVHKWWDGLSTAEKATVRDTVRRQSKKPVNIRMSKGALSGLLSGGRLKTSHEHDTGRGSGYDETRSAYENDVLGGRHPVYGYVGDPASVDVYGDYEITLNSGVRNRTTVSVGDSLNGATDVHPINDVGSLSDQQLLNSISRHETQPGGLQTGRFKQFLEAQVDGVSLKDVAHVTVPSDAPASLIKQLEAMGIKVDVQKTEEDLALEAARRKLGLL